MDHARGAENYLLIASRKLFGHNISDRTWCSVQAAAVYICSSYINIITQIADKTTFHKILLSIVLVEVVNRPFPGFIMLPRSVLLFKLLQPLMRRLYNFTKRIWIMNVIFNMKKEEIYVFMMFIIFNFDKNAKNQTQQLLTLREHTLLWTYYYHQMIL